MHTEIDDGAACLPVLHALSRRGPGLLALDRYGRSLLDGHGISAAVTLLDNARVTRAAARAVGQGTGIACTDLDHAACSEQTSTPGYTADQPEPGKHPARNNEPRLKPPSTSLVSMTPFGE